LKSRIVILVNEGYKTRNCDFQTRNSGVQIFEDSLYSKMTDLLVTKDPKRDYYIVNKFFKRFKVNCYIIILSNEEVVIEIIF
jgi:hypothetical protein